MEPGARRNAVLEHVEDDFAVAGRDALRFVVVVRLGVTEPVGMTMLAAADEPDAREIDGRPSTAIGIASAKWIGTGANRRLTAS